MGRYDSTIQRVSEHLGSIGARLKPPQRTKLGFKLDGEIINLHPPHDPEWICFTKLRKLDNNGMLDLTKFRELFELEEEDVKDGGSARFAIWIRLSVGPEVTIKIIDWIQAQ